MVPLQWEVDWLPSALALGSLQLEVTWGSPFQCPKDLDLLHQQLPEHWQLLEHHWLVEQLILSILSSRIAAATRACWRASFMRVIISSYESHLAAANFLYVLWFAAANSI